MWHAARPYNAMPAGGGAPPLPDDAQARLDQVGGESRPQPTGIFNELSNALESARSGLSNFLELVSLEARRAGLMLAWMVASGLVAAVCITGAWLGLLAALAIWAVSVGFPLTAAAIAFASTNLLAAAALIWACIRMSRALLFSATRRQLAGHSPVTPPQP